MIETEWRAEELTWAEQDRFAERTLVERVFSRRKDEFGARAIRVRGVIRSWPTSGSVLLALTVDQLLKRTG